ncbi:hypothetical protein POPTR_004G191400v4 [Populus trichocarpa]|nr:hypothetical protein POPTR_004G191400v4 [Populus trichocarpa]
MDQSAADSKPGCRDKCGNVSVPYPFGIDESSCAENQYLFLNCSQSDGHGPEKLWFANIPVLSISVLEGLMVVSIFTAYDCYNQSGAKMKETNLSIHLGQGPYMFSDTRNMFTAIGCDTMGFFSNADVTYAAACISSCDEMVSLAHNSSCSGSGCCQTSIPQGLKSLSILSSSIYNHINVSDFNPCGYAFLADKRTFKASDWQLSGLPDGNASDAVIEWVVETKSCEQAGMNTSSYACRNNTNCNYSKNGQGYRCSCKDGFTGNPYLSPGCQDIDECADRQRYPCKGKCKNTPGNYTCSCPMGMHGDGKTGCQGFGIATIASVTGGTISLVIIGVLLYIILRKLRKVKNFRENGGMVLKHQRVRIFSEAELAKATENYNDHKKLGEGGFGCVYKGVLPDNTQLAVKKFKGVDKAQMNEEFQHEIGMVLQVNHKNVVKLLGLCLQTKVPLLVYEFISNGTLFHHIHDKKSQVLRTWTDRLRVAAETALALEYLHSLANPPMIHGDVKTVNILLDEDGTAKIADFGASVLISPGQTDIATKIQGTFGYLDPEYLMTGNLTVKSDVFSFGVVLVELMTGQKPNSNAKSGEKRNVVQDFISSLENNHLFKILDFEADEEELEEIEVVAELAKRCVNSSGVKRPSMKEVSDELSRLTSLHEDLWGQKNSEETEHLLGKSALSFNENASPSMNEPQMAQTVISLEIENYTNSI